MIVYKVQNFNVRYFALTVTIIVLYAMVIIIFIIELWILEKFLLLLTISYTSQFPYIKISNSE